MAREPDRDFAEARERIDRGEWRGALKSLDRARQGYAGRRDRAGLEHVLRLLEVISDEDDATRLAKTNLDYAAKQNVRLATRVEAASAGEEWVDPYPDLDAPREHTGIHLSRGLKVWIAGGVLVGGALAALWLIAVVTGLIGAFGRKTLAVRFENDGGRRVTVKWCSSVACDRFGDPMATDDLEPHTSSEEDLPKDDVVDLFVVYDGTGHRIGCLPIHVDRTYARLRNKSAEVTVKISQMTACPGAVVSPTLS